MKFFLWFLLWYKIFVWNTIKSNNFQASSYMILHIYFLCLCNRLRSALMVKYPKTLIYVFPRSVCRYSHLKHLIQMSLTWNNKFHNLFLHIFNIKILNHHLKKKKASNATRAKSKDFNVPPKKQNKNKKLYTNNGMRNSTSEAHRLSSWASPASTPSSATTSASAAPTSSHCQHRQVIKYNY